MCILFRCHAIEAVLTFYVVLQSFLCGSMWGVCEAQLCFKEPGDICQGDTRETRAAAAFHFPSQGSFSLILTFAASRRPKDPLKGSTSQQPHRALTAASQRPHSSLTEPSQQRTHPSLPFRKRKSGRRETCLRVPLFRNGDYYTMKMEKEKMQMDTFLYFLRGASLALRNFRGYQPWYSNFFWNFYFPADT